MSRKLYRADVAALINVKVDSLQRYRLPEPDGRDSQAGHARPWWWDSTIAAWIAARPGRGRRWVQ